MGVRGPFGTAWPVDQAHGHDVVLIAGGIGLAPIRPALYHVLLHRALYGRVVLLYGARTPRDMLFPKELREWRSRFDVVVDVTVDRATMEWQGAVGVVTKMVQRSPFDPQSAMAFICGPEVMIRYAAQALAAAGHVRVEHLRLHGAEHEVRGGRLRPLPVRAVVRLQGRPGLPLRPDPALLRHAGGVRWRRPKPKLAVFKFASCDGCQLSLLDCEDELLAVVGEVQIANFLEASREVVKGPYDLTLVEGSITTVARRRAHPAGAQAVRASWSRSGPAPPPAASRPCATSRTCASSPRAVYATPEYISTLERLDPDLPARAGRLRAARLPDQQGASSSRCWAPSCAAAGPTSRPTPSASSASAGAPSA